MGTKSNLWFFLNWCLHSHGACQSMVWFLGRNEGRRLQLACGQESGGVNPAATKPSRSPLFGPSFGPSADEPVESLLFHVCSAVRPSSQFKHHKEALMCLMWPTAICPSLQRAEERLSGLCIEEQVSQWRSTSCRE